MDAGLVAEVGADRAAAADFTEVVAEAVECTVVSMEVAVCGAVRMAAVVAVCAVASMVVALGVACEAANIAAVVVACGVADITR